MFNDRVLAVLAACGLVIASHFDPTLLGPNKDVIVGLVCYYFGKTLGVINGGSSGGGDKSG